MISAKLVFRDDAGNLCPPGHINSLTPEKFYTDWAAGKLQRDVVVQITDPTVVERGFRNPHSLEFQLAGVETYYAWGAIDEELLLAPKLLTVYRDLSPAQVLVTRRNNKDFHDIAWHMLKAGVAESIVVRARGKLYATFYPLSADVSHTADWYDRDPKDVVRDIILELLEKWTKRDNATVLHLLNTACNTINDVFAFKELTSFAVDCMRTQVMRWQFSEPQMHVLATARALANMDPEKWKRWHMHPICLGAPHDVTWADYTSSSRDQKDLFLCAAPSALGARGVKIEIQAEPIRNTQTPSTEYGWLWSSEISTQVTNSRAVVAGAFEE